MKFRALLALPFLVSCSGQPHSNAGATPTPTVAVPKTLVAADYDPTSFGAKIDMKRGDDAEYPIIASTGKTIGTALAFVACPRDTTECIPTDMPAGTVYTYVITIKPNPPVLGTEEPLVPLSDSETGGSVPQSPPILFQLTRKAAGFNGGVGYSRSQALAALGSEEAITVTVDSGQIIWRVTDGSGWAAGMPITFWWQSTLAPDGYRKAYALEINGQHVPVEAPFPKKQPVPATSDH